ncbi:MAG: ATP-dependent helicase [Chloroflexota bacterium]|nr:ATP-dependent helicase [Chloroflexota bacterium]
MVIEAYAGSGKTSTLRMLANADRRKRVLFLAYNRAAKDDAKASFPINTRCYTTHGLAYQPMIDMACRIGKGGKYVPGIQLAKMMKINGPARLTSDRVLAPGQLAAVVKNMIKRFCYSADSQVTGWHVPRDMKWLTDPEELKALQRIVPPIAQRVWDQDITQPDGIIPMDFDYFLKAYALTDPELPGDVILLDEAQDSNACTADLVRKQATKYGKQVVMVGDTYQQLYAWRLAINAMSGFAEMDGVTVLNLSKSFRFGQGIADEANKWLTHVLGARLPLSGNEKIQSRIGQCSGVSPDAILCRTNAEALRRAIEALGQGLKVAFPKGTGELIALVKGAADIKRGRPSEHPDLMGFATWGQVQDFAENEPGGEDLQLFVRLVDQYGVDELFAILSEIGNEEKGSPADVVISTAHGAKGREWRQVEIAEDFQRPKEDPEAPVGKLPEIPADLARLAYVAVTRGQFVVNRGSLAFVDEYLPSAVPALENEPEPEPTVEEPADLGSPAVARAMSLAQI